LLHGPCAYAFRKSGKVARCAREGPVDSNRGVKKKPPRGAAALREANYLFARLSQRMENHGKHRARKMLAGAFATAGFVERSRGAAFLATSARRARAAAGAAISRVSAVAAAHHR